MILALLHLLQHLAPWGGDGVDFGHAAAAASPPPHVPTEAERAAHRVGTSMATDIDLARSVEDAARRQYEAAAPHLAQLNDPGLSGMLEQAFGSLLQADQAAGAAGAEIRGLLENHRLPDTGRQVEIENVLNRAKATVKEAHDKAEANVIALDAEMKVAALPPAPENEAKESHLREDLRLHLEGRSNIPAELAHLASGPNRDLAGLIARTGIADAYLARMPVDRERKDARAYIQVAAIEGSRLHGTAGQRAAAEALLRTVVPVAKAMVGAGKVATRRWMDHATAPLQRPPVP